MSIQRWLQNLRSALAPARVQRGSLRARTHRPHLEVLEDRSVPAFLAPIGYDVGNFPQAIVAADFNNDNLQDLAVVNEGDSTVSVLPGNADGTFQEPAQTSGTGSRPLSLAVGDFDGDGNLDLATANAYDVRVLMGDGAGAFAGGAYIDLGYDEPNSMAVGDFNGDGLLDLGVTANYHYSDDYFGEVIEGHAHVLLGHGDGSFSGPYTTFLSYGYHDAAVAADINGDAFDDFVTLNNYGYVEVLLGAGSVYSFYTGAYSLSLAAADLDADGDNDFVTANYTSDTVSVLLGNGAGSFSSGGSYRTGDYPAGVVLGDFSGDGIVDVATANNSLSTDLSVLYGRGDGTFALAVNSAVGGFPIGVAAGDFNGDGWLDAATANYGGNVSVLLNDQNWESPDALPSVGISDVTVTEGNTGSVVATFTLTLSSASGTPIIVHYETANGSATAGSDYAAGSGDVTIPAGQISATFTVAIHGDRLVEANESFAVDLSTPTNATIADGRGITTVLDDEPRISISDATKREGRKNTTLFTFTVMLSAAYDQPVTMSYRTVNGTATSGDGDYVAKTGTLTFAPGQTSKTITIEVKGDSNREGNETFYLELFANSSNSSFSKSREIGTILNDD